MTKQKADLKQSPKTTELKPTEFRSLKAMAKYCYAILRSDRDINIGVAGMTGEGKSCFSYQLCKEYGKVNGIGWDANNITWSRDELINWIDGKDKKPQYSALLPDELFSFAYKRDWFKDGNKDFFSQTN